MIKKYLFIISLFMFISCITKEQEIKSLGNGKSVTDSIDIENKTDYKNEDTVTAKLNWNIPKKRADGTELLLDDVAEYIIKYGEDEKNLDQKIFVKNPSITTQDISGLKVNKTYFFSIITVDSSGQQSQLATIISKNF